MRMHRHHLLEIILWPNGDGTFRKIINTIKRLSELGIYDDWKLTITIPADEHLRMHNHNRTDEYWNKVSQSMSIAKSGEKNNMYGKTHSDATKRKMSKAKKGKKLSAEHRAKMCEALSGENNPMYGKTHSAEVKAKMSAAKKGRRWYNNGVRSVLNNECPIGFVPGRIYKRKEV